MTMYFEKNVKNQKPLTLCHHHQDEKKPCLQRQKESIKQMAIISPY